MKKGKASILTLCLQEYYTNSCGYDLMHPQELINHLKIKYDHATPQSMGNQWWFCNCSNLPEELPEFLTLRENVDPYEYIDFVNNEQKEECQCIEINGSIFLCSKCVKDLINKSI